MLIKEYRIPLPLSVEEYKIAQLYMIQKKSRLESTGSGSAVEIIENTPYENGPGGSGQYTKKIYHIGSHLPGWLKALLPKTALRVEEEAWNAYPYTKTRHTCPFIEKFFIDIETHYLPDHGETENIFDLSPLEKKNREIDLIDPVKDTFPQKDYKKEEDPHFFVSTNTGRGPLQDDWLESYQNGSNKSTVMCAYKLIKVEFKYWGMQSKIENFIQSGIRNPILVGHRQAWAWQDEWHGLTIDDIRQLEKQAQLELAKRMDALKSEGEETSSDTTKTNINNNDSDDAMATSSVSNDDRGTEEEGVSSENTATTVLKNYDLTKKRESSIVSISNQERLLGIHMKHIEQIDSGEETDDDDSLFYDALDFFEASPYDDAQESLNSSMELNQHSDTVTSPTITLPSFPYTQHVQTLIFVIQGGSITDCNVDMESRRRDFQTFERLFTSTCNYCYPGSRSKILFEVIECDSSVTSKIMKQLMELNVESQKGPMHTIDDYDHLSNSFPFSSLPLLILQSAKFHKAVYSMVEIINSKYKEMLAGNVLDEMNHEIYFLCDSVGGLFAFQALCQYSSRDDLSSESSEEDDADIDNSLYFDFILNGMFTFGSPIGLVSLNKKISSGKDFNQPRCRQLYNVFHPFDPTSSRIEPIIDKSFSNIRPAPVPRSHAFPFNDDIQYNYTVLYDDVMDLPEDSQSEATTLAHPEADRKVSSSSISSVARRSAYSDKAFCSSWWGTKRIDYMTYCPEGLQQFPVSTLIQLCYNSYWESKDIITFILWQILDGNYLSTRPIKLPEIPSILNLEPLEKWLKKGTALKIKKMTPNHRANDVISVGGAQHFITGKFAYGPVDMASLSGEKVDIYLSKRPQLNEWKSIGTDKTDKHGRLMYTVPNRNLEPGVYSVKMVVRGDHSCIDCNMAILPPQTEAIVFSIDGSFLASYSIRGVDPKIRGGAVDVVRHWQELGYLIIYVSSRLLFQKYQVMSWLSAHNFPFGIVSFCETVSKDYQRHKIEFLKNICKFENVHIRAAYGSSRDISVYSSSLKLPSQKIFILGKKKSKKADHVQWIQDGYNNHLSDLRKGTFARPSANKKTFTALGSLGGVENLKTSGLPKKKLSERKSSSSKQKKLTSDKENKEKRGTSFMKSFRISGRKGQDPE